MECDKLNEYEGKWHKITQPAFSTVWAFYLFFEKRPRNTLKYYSRTVHSDWRWRIMVRVVMAAVAGGSKVTSFFTLPNHFPYCANCSAFRTKPTYVAVFFGLCKIIRFSPCQNLVNQTNESCFNMFLMN